MRERKSCARKSRRGGVSLKIERRLEENIRALEELFEGCGDIVARKIPVGGRVAVYVTYIDGLVDRAFIEQQFIQNLVIRLRGETFAGAGHFVDIMDTISEAAISSADFSEITDIDAAASAMMTGDCVVLASGSEKGAVLSSKGWPARGVSAPEIETTLQGPKDAFTETIRTNTALIRRRIRDKSLKVRQMQVGRRSKTDIALIYLDDVVRKSLLSEVLERIAGIDIDAVQDSGYIEQLIEDDKRTPFPQTQITERPDKAASAVLEGRIAIAVDNSPFMLLVPATFNIFFQSSEDYYQRPLIMSLLRVGRYISAFMSTTLPGLYIALTVYNPELLPTQLALKMAAARQSIAFPAVVEILIMELSFELLREAGIRLPGPYGGTLGIVGGLIMGQAAVEAGIVSPIIVIVAALSGIASFAVPQQSLVTGFRLFKFLIIALSAFFGLFGFCTAILALATHLTSLHSFGVPYMYPLGCSDLGASGDMKDTLIRAPLQKMTERPIFANPAERRRMGGEK